MDWSMGSGGHDSTTMLGTMEKLFRAMLPNNPVQWLTNDGMAESIVRTMRRDYISITPKPDRLMVVRNLAETFEHYNE